MLETAMPAKTKRVVLCRLDGIHEIMGLLGAGIDAPLHLDWDGGRASLVLSNSRYVGYQEKPCVTAAPTPTLE